MPVPTETEMKNLIVDEVNDPENRVSARIDTIWALYSRYPLELRYQMALVKACDIALGSIRDDVNFSQSGDLAVSLAQKFDHVSKMREAAVEERDRIALELKAGGTPAIGQLTQTAPYPAPAGWTDGNEIETPYRSRKRLG